MTTVADWMQHLEAFAPLHLAASWDNVGLLLGERNRPCDRVLTCLTVTPEVVAEAVAESVALIVSHHPILFKPVKALSDNTADGLLLLPLLRAGIAVYSPHSAFDNCPGGINDGLAKRFGLRNIRALRPADSPAEYKLVVFVTEADLAKVSEAIFASGGGIIGVYEQCSFRVPGTGTFYGTEGTNPVVGECGRREVVPEVRLEVVVPEAKVSAAIAAMRGAHSYEEPAFDVYPLKPKPARGSGRFGELEFAIPLADFAALVKRTCGANCTQFVGNATEPVQIVALACGAAGEYLNDAIRIKADVFVTGEARFHDLLTAEAAGIGLVLPGHYASERPAIEDLATRLRAAFPEAVVWASRAEREPLVTV